MKALKQIAKTREYLDYLERHILNVRKAWKEIQIKCSDMRFIYDDLFYNQLGGEIEHHDISKLSEEEFIQYRKAFYPTDKETKYDMTKAWEHHKLNNPHHWENWTKNTGCQWHPNDWEADCAHMVVDWMAMGYEFGDTAQEYYEKNKDKIILPEIAVNFMYEIFKRIAPTHPLDDDRG
jgi:hypothetical protein